MRKSLGGRVASALLSLVEKLPLGLLDQLDQRISWQRGFGYAVDVESEALVMASLLGPLHQTGGGWYSTLEPM